jgi:AraC family transcriptional regulator, regulatory protein of adaptative response / DNA-3-methyladenine glycosylase II
VARVLPHPDRLWRAIEARDRRFDGWVFCALTTTALYCNPSCVRRGRSRENVRLFVTAAAAQEAGYRACRRCRPDAAPGSPEWDRRPDLIGRSMRLIADGIVDREGVAGLASRLGCTERHIGRQLVAVAGAGPLALARAQRAHTARVLLETTSLRTSEAALAAGFHSVRQLDYSVRHVYAASPRELRARAGARSGDASGGPIELRLPYRSPLEAQAAIAYLARRAVPGVEEIVGGAYRRSLRLPYGSGVVEIAAADGYLRARYWLEDLRDLPPAVQRCRLLFDLDADPQSVLEALRDAPLVGPLVRAAPGRRSLGHAGAEEVAFRALLGQRVSLAGAATLTGRLVRDYGEPLARPVGGVTHLFPSAASLLRARPERLPMPVSRANALLALAGALAQGSVVIDEGADPAEAYERLLELPGIGPWTAGYVALRALRDPDAFLAGDLGVRRALEALGQDASAANATRIAESWRPYRAYALQHLWATLGATATTAAAASAAHPAPPVSPGTGPARPVSSGAASPARRNAARLLGSR